MLKALDVNLFIVQVSYYYVLERQSLLALISALMSDFPGNEKILWVLIILLLPFLGSVLYFLIGRNQRISR